MSVGKPIPPGLALIDVIDHFELPDRDQLFRQILLPRHFGTHYGCFLNVGSDTAWSCIV